MSEATDRPAPQEFERVLTGATATVASFEEEHLTVLQRTQRFLHAYPTVVPFVVLLLGVLLGVLVNPSRFTAASNFSTILTQVMVIGIVGVGQTLVILTAGIDLSVGVIMVISSVVMGRLAVYAGVPTLIAFPIGLLVGAVFGYLNGILITRLKMPPFIVTLGTLSIIGALNTYYSQSETIGMQDIEEKAWFLQIMGNQITIGGARIMWGTFLMLAVAAVVWYVLNRTAYGRHIYATGDDPEAARLAGINTDRILLSVYVFAGLIAAIAGWALIGRVGAISPVVIGGTSLFGGRGSIIGTLVGALIVGVFRSAVSLAGLDVLWQEFAIGVLIIVAVALDQWIRRVSK
jgi:fructose transport system permease protein